MPAAPSGLYLIDGNSLMYRAFFAVPPFKTSKGLPTNAIFGFIKMIFKLLKNQNPDYLGVVFDPPGPTFRSDLFEQYKAHRPKVPDDLSIQRSYLRQVVEAMRLPVLEQPGFEADDVIGSMVEKYKTHCGVIIVSGDKDLMQFVENGKVWLYDSMKEVFYQREEVKAKMGVYPEQIIDLLSLMGDTSDNIPGVKGVGPKTAEKLLDEYGSLRGVYEHLDQITGSVQAKLKSEEELAFLSYKLATIKTDLTIDKHIDDLKIQGFDIPALIELFTELEFSSLKKELEGFGTFEASLYEKPKKIYEKRYTTIIDQDGLEKVLQEAREQKMLAIDTETTSTDALNADLVGVSLSCHQNIGYYIPIAHAEYDANLDKAYVLEKLFELIDDDQILKVGHNIKYDLTVLEQERNRLKTGATIPKKKGITDQMNLL